ncbi:hypothetical protein [Streptomyces huasconensis]|uniref:hypothetical protein n=1 Tax=Streptomyces huasconensis TaxID=1854574 RepID=UPI0033F40B51
MPAAAIAFAAYPFEVQRGDFVHAEGAYRQVIDMRHAWPGSKSLIFRDNTVWLMSQQHVIYRPVLPDDQ